MFAPIRSRSASLQILEEKRALFSDLIDGVPAQALGRLDLDALLRAAAPAF